MQRLKTGRRIAVPVGARHPYPRGHGAGALATSPSNPLCRFGHDLRNGAIQRGGDCFPPGGGRGLPPDRLNLLGACMLAEAALLDGRRATTHWFHALTFRARLPAVVLDEDPIFINDGPVWTPVGASEWKVGEEAGSAASAPTPSRQAGSQNCRRACFCNALMKATRRITSPGTRRPMARLEYTASSERADQSRPRGQVPPVDYIPFA